MTHASKSTPPPAYPFRAKTLSASRVPVETNEIFPLELVHIGGAKRTVEVIAAEAGTKQPRLSVHWGIAGTYSLDLNDNKMVIVSGNRVSRTYPWRAVDIAAARGIWVTLKAMQRNERRAYSEARREEESFGLARQREREG